MSQVRRAAVILAGVAAIAGLFLLLRDLEPRLGTGRFLSGMVAGLLLAGVGLAQLIRSTGRKTQEIREERLRVRLRAPNVPSGDGAIYHWKVRSLDGGLVAMDDFIRRVMFLNFWSTMCLPCVAELGSIERLHATLEREGVVFLCVASDPDLERLRAWLTANHVTVPVFALAGDDLPPMFDSEFIPATYIVGADSRIAFKHEGAAAWDHPSVARLLRGLLAEADILAPTTAPLA